MGKAQGAKAVPPGKAPSTHDVKPQNSNKGAPAQPGNIAKAKANTPQQQQAAVAAAATAATAAQAKGQQSQQDRKDGAKAAVTGADSAAGQKKAKRDEIDDIFNFGKKIAKNDEAAELAADAPEELKEIADKIKRAREEKKQKQATAAAAAAEPSAKKAKVGGSADDLFGDGPGGKRKRTEEGYLIYSEDELGLGKKAAGGDTALCPFDCDCCF